MAYLGSTPANAVVTSQQIADGVITTSDLADNAVTTAKVNNNAVTVAKLSAEAQSLNWRNRIINGDMRIDQRNNGASVTPTNGQYTLDRWAAWQTASRFSVQRNAGSVTPPVGFANYLGATSLGAASLAASDYNFIVQQIEGFNTSDLAWGTASAQAVTLSFWVRSSLTGTFGGALINSAANRSYPFSFVVNAANTWEQKSITITGDTTGTWLTDNGVGIGVRFGLGSGSSFSGTAGAWAAGNIVQPTGTVSVVGTSGATFYITGVQLEKGSTATSFDYRPYGTELALCRRYTRLNAFVVPVNTSPAFGYLIDMRAVPTVSGGGAGFSTAATTADLLVVSQTATAVQTLTLNAEL